MNLNTQSNTPPNGDFARYVDQLSARAALALRTASVDGSHALDVGMPPSSEPHAGLSPGAVAPRGRAATRPPVPAQASAASTAGGAALPFKVVRAVAAVWLLALVGMFLFDAPFGMILLVLAGGFWVAKQMRHRLLPAGVTSWSQWAQEAARNAAEKQRQQQGK
ncbi:hypothetical protein [Variovorax boronicumulans]|uniref:hypothetical protein n=1 Tax=Variovorax boronicumulans TaxID=436515 RepID=UPI001C563067